MAEYMEVRCKKCPFSARGSEEELTGQIVVHAKTEHGDDMTEAEAKRRIYRVSAH